MKVTLLSGLLLLASCGAHKNPDLVIKLRSDMDETSDVAILKNLSETKVYTATVRRRVYRKHYRVYYIGDEMPDTVITKRDTTVLFAEVVVPPHKWRYLGPTFEGTGYMLLTGTVRADTGYQSKIRFKLMESRPGGDAKQVLKTPQPFEKEQPYNMLGDQDFSELYQGDIRK